MAKASFSHLNHLTTDGTSLQFPEKLACVWLSGYPFTTHGHQYVRVGRHLEFAKSNSSVTDGETEAKRNSVVA